MEIDGTIAWLIVALALTLGGPSFTGDIIVYLISSYYLLKLGNRVEDTIRDYRDSDTPEKA